MSPGFEDSSSRAAALSERDWVDRSTGASLIGRSAALSRMGRGRENRSLCFCSRSLSPAGRRPG
jgi:hypothetical protein